MSRGDINVGRVEITALNAIYIRICVHLENKSPTEICPRTSEENYN
jgi:hypothetical protein